MENGTNSPRLENKTLTVVYILLVAVCCMAGLIFNSFGLFADGALALLFLSDILKGERKKFVPSTVISVVGALLGGYAAVLGFLNLSATIGYADDAVSVYAFPLFALVIFGKAALIAFSEKGSHDRADAIFGLVVTLIVVAGTLLTFYGEHFFEPAVASAIGIYAVYRGVKSIFNPTEHHHHHHHPAPAEEKTEDVKE